MKRVYQTRFDTEGNCLQACLATVLGMSLEEVPDFVADVPADMVWTDSLRAWLHHKGFGLMIADISNDCDMERLLPFGVCLVGGKTSRGSVQHEVVYLNGKLWHDPYPEGNGLTQLCDMFLIFPLRPLEICRCWLPSQVMSEGGPWLGAVRREIQRTFVNGENVEWGSDTLLTPAPSEKMVEYLAASAVAADRNDVQKLPGAFRGGC